MTDLSDTPVTPATLPVHIIGLSYISLYFKALGQAVDFYSQVFGQPNSVDEKQQIFGWHLGTTWLTLLPSKAGINTDGNPSNTEFAIQVSTPNEVDRLHSLLLQAGATSFMSPDDTSMYEAMRFSCVDDPFGARIDIYCQLNGMSEIGTEGRTFNQPFPKIRSSKTLRNKKEL